MIIRYKKIPHVLIFLFPTLPEFGGDQQQSFEAVRFCRFPSVCVSVCLTVCMVVVIMIIGAVIIVVIISVAVIIIFIVVVIIATP